MRRNIKIKLAYDGTHYLGWQATQEGPSIEQKLQEALQQILQHPIQLQAASRTDAGVHALGQIVNFFTEKEIRATDLTRSLNALLPTDIAVLDAAIANETFHPTLNAQGKEYHYNVCCGPTQLPHHRHYSWHYHYPVDIAPMETCIPLLTGTRDYSALCNEINQQNYSDTIRTVHSIEILPLSGNRMRFKIRGNHFLYKMVRNMVGTLLYIGCGKIQPEELSEILESGKRANAGVTAPAHGLFLAEVFY